VPVSRVSCHSSPDFRMAVGIPVELGCLDTELVLRGGRLPEPLLLTGLRVVNGKQFVTLSKSNSVLNRFLSNSSTCKRPLAGTLVFEKLTKLRNDGYRQLLTQAASGPGDGHEGQADLAALLDLDASPGVIVASSPGDEPADQRRFRKRFVDQVPRTLTATMQQLGRVAWELTMLSEGGRKNPAMEASAANFVALLEWVNADLNDEAVRRPQYGSLVAAAERRSPRGPKHAREYFVNGKWVTKISQAVPAPNSTPSRRFRTLKRWGSDHEERPKNKRERATRQRARKTSGVAPLLCGFGEADGEGHDFVQVKEMEDCLTEQ
jgi:hypothetical protein